MKLKNKETGEIATLIVDGAYKFVTNFAVEDDEMNRLGEYNSLAELNAEWKDAPKESKEYWFVNSSGGVEVIALEDDDPEDTEGSREIGNYFLSKEEAEKAIQKLKAFKRLKDKGFEIEKWEWRFGVGRAWIAMKGACPDEEMREDLTLLFGGGKNEQ